MLLINIFRHCSNIVICRPLFSVYSVRYQPTGYPIKKFCYFIGLRTKYIEKKQNWSGSWSSLLW